jgi:hypothetical protein
MPHRTPNANHAKPRTARDAQVIRRIATIRRQAYQRFAAELGILSAKTFGGGIERNALASSQNDE